MEMTAICERGGRRLLAALLLPAFAWTLVGASHSHAAAAEVVASPDSVRQGECVFAYARPGGDAIAGECRWLDKVYSLYPAGDGYRAILPVPPDAPAGQQKLIIVLQERAGNVTETPATVTIVKRDFGVQNLRMKKQTSQLYRDPKVAEEGKTIRAALSRSSHEQLWRGRFVRPCQGRVSTGFGVARSINGEIQYRHKGLDIAAPAGTAVLAPNAGVVTLARQDYRLHGKTVVLDHGQGVGSVYLHLSEINVEEGQRLVLGERVGKVGATGAATGAHLHWGVYVNGEAIDPGFWTNLPDACR